MRDLKARMQLARARRSCRRHGHEWSHWEAKADTRFQYRICLVCPQREERSVTAAAAAGCLPLPSPAARQAAEPDPGVYASGRWRNPHTGKEAGQAQPERAAEGLFDPDRGPSTTIPGSALLTAGIDPHPAPMAQFIQSAAPPREHPIGLSGPAAPACPGHERVIRELRAQVRRLDAENWRLLQRLHAGPTNQHDPDGSTTDGGAANGPDSTGQPPAAG